MLTAVYGVASFPILKNPACILDLVVKVPEEGNLEPLSCMREASEEVQRQTGGINWQLISERE